jgi:hypothetical protein
LAGSAQNFELSKAKSRHTADKQRGKAASRAKLSASACELQKRKPLVAVECACMSMQIDGRQLALCAYETIRRLSAWIVWLAHSDGDCHRRFRSMPRDEQR